jgi:hypothetical protein
MMGKTTNREGNFSLMEPDKRENLINNGDNNENVAAMFMRNTSLLQRPQKCINAKNNPIKKWR